MNRPVLGDNVKHPIESRLYVVPTPMSDTICDLVEGILDNATPGGIIYGRPRLGKSYALKLVRSFIHNNPKYANIPIYLMDCNSDTRTPAMFYSDMLSSVNHAIVKGACDIKRGRLVEFLHEDGRATGRIIFIFDEAQNLLESQYKSLIGISNRLEEKNVRMTILLVGQEELHHQRNAFLVTGCEQVVGRFMVAQKRFYGIRTVSELLTCLQGYDETSCYPKDSGWSYTRYYFPEQYANGFRLADFAEAYFKIISDIRAEKEFKGPLEIPMQYFTRSIDHLLLKYGVEGEGVKGFNSKMLKEAIIASGYVDAEVYKTKMIDLRAVKMNGKTSEPDYDGDDDD